MHRSVTIDDVLDARLSVRARLAAAFPEKPPRARIIEYRSGCHSSNETQHQKQNFGQPIAANCC